MSNALITVDDTEIHERTATPVGDLNAGIGALAVVEGTSDWYIKSGATANDWVKIAKLTTSGNFDIGAKITSLTAATADSDAVRFDQLSPTIVTPGSYPHSAANWTTIMVDTSASRTINLPNPATTRYLEIIDATGTCDLYPVTFARYGSESIDGYAGSYKVAVAYGRWLLRSNGTNWFIISRPVPLIWLPTIINGSITATVTPVTTGSAYRGEICPEGRNYYIEFTFEIGTVNGNPGALIFYTHSSVALDRVARSGTHTTLIAAATELCRWTKGSQLSLGDSMTIRTSSSYFVDAGERLGVNGIGAYFFAGVDAATSAVFAGAVRMVPA